MTDPEKGPTKEGLDRFDAVVRHLGALNMTPYEDGVSWPKVDTQSLDRTNEILTTAIALRKRRAKPVAAQHQTAEKKP